MTDEADLLRRAVAGDEGALEELLDAHLPGLRGFVRLHAGAELRRHEESTDLVQSVCREILRTRGRFEHPADNGFKRWLYATALRKIQSRAAYWRAARRDDARERSFDDGAADRGLLACYGSMCTPSAEVAGREEIARIERAFDRLPDEYREVITLCRIAGLPREDVAAHMGRTPGAVSTLLYRALRRLSELLDAPASPGCS
jgi:RNA polymerase sigma-70 factor (ECF subfamily)